MTKNEDIEKQIIHLTELWYRIVSLDHHKDRDCHWYINKTYSYGNKPTYRVEHIGYIHKDIDEQFGSSREAHEFLIQSLKDAIREEQNWSASVLDKTEEWGEDQIERAKKILQLCDEE